MRSTPRGPQLALPTVIMLIGVASVCALLFGAASDSAPPETDAAVQAGASARAGAHGPEQVEAKIATEPLQRLSLADHRPRVEKIATEPLRLALTAGEPRGQQKIAGEPLLRQAPTRDEGREPITGLRSADHSTVRAAGHGPAEDGPALTGTIGGPTASREQPADASLLDVDSKNAAVKVQRRLAELGHFSGPPTGVWGAISRAALRSFKEANQLPSDDDWDAATQEALFRSDARRADPFVGRWAADAMACSRGSRKGGHLPTMIESNGARAGDVTCAFKSKRQVGQAWDVVAQCSNARERWTARIRLSVEADRLTWTSERGTQNYVRCNDQMQVAGAPR